MPFFVFNISNHHENYSDYHVKFFNTELEKDDFINSILEVGEKVYFQKSDTLLDIISRIAFDTFENTPTTHQVVDVYMQFIDKFGLNLVNTEFPNELVGVEFINNVIIEYEKISNYIMDQAHETMSQKEYVDQQSDWETSYDDETRKWDDETDGSWRTGNDFG
ncbi:MAG TPA: hypothetical protein PLL09_00290 [Flavobacterium sp.]|uniref:hypothetical protein n=1 Tax=unclassified Flavobacterium TaxID=196869 RepID=UPI0025C5026D|nr:MULTISPECIES: hypothetical protein [unclassified Flavobacterium]HRE76238.1 hypothetical protein [Flavobacterium sp.]